MKNKQPFIFSIILFLLLLVKTPMKARSLHRPPDPLSPYITARWDGDKTIYTHRNFCYEEYPIFRVFDRNYFNKHKLPNVITYDENKLVDTQILNNLIEKLLTEIHQKKKRYSHFIVLQHKNFNRKKKCGLIVLKFKDYPFVVKLFIETPKTFINPYCKGFEPRFFFVMAGGVNRHISGLTRIKNLELLNQKISHNKNWHGRVKTPRKWFWLPKNNKLLHITGKNIGNKKELATILPGTYAIIADAINFDEEIKISHKKRNKIIMQLCNDLELIIDPHSNNFIFKYDEKKNNFYIVIIDTEHFPTIVGLKDKKKFRDHYSWYLYLTKKCFYATFLFTKKQRLALQTAPHYYALK